MDLCVIIDKPMRKITQNACHIMTLDQTFRKTSLVQTGAQTETHLSENSRGVHLWAYLMGILTLR